MKKLYVLIRSNYNEEMDKLGYGSNVWSALLIDKLSTCKIKLKNEIKKDNVLKKAGFDILSKKYRIVDLGDIIEEKVNF